MIPQLAFLAVKMEAERRERENTLGTIEAERREIELELANKRLEYSSSAKVNGLTVTAQATICFANRVFQQVGKSLNILPRAATPDCSDNC